MKNWQLPYSVYSYVHTIYIYELSISDIKSSSSVNIVNFKHRKKNPKLHFNLRRIEKDLQNRNSNIDCPVVSSVLRTKWMKIMNIKRFFNNANQFWKCRRLFDWKLGRGFPEYSKDFTNSQKTLILTKWIKQIDLQIHFDFSTESFPISVYILFK